MADVEELLIRLDATTEVLRRELRKGDAQIERFQRTTDRRLRVLDQRFEKLGQVITRRLLPALVTVGSFTGLRGLIADAAELGDLAERLGVGAERLQELFFVAEQNGSTIRDFTDAMSRLNRRLGLFAQDGGGPAAAAFKELGISATDASGRVRSADDVFDEIVTRLEAYQTEAEKAALASALFGDDAGPRLVQLLSIGKRGLDEFSQKARESGAVIDEELIRRAGELDKKIAALSTTISTEFKSAVLELIEVISNAASGEGGPFRVLEGMIDAAATKLSDAMDLMDRADYVDKLQRAKELEAEIARLAKSASDPDNNILVRLVSGELMQRAQRQLAELRAEIRKIENDFAVRREFGGTPTGPRPASAPAPVTEVAARRFTGAAGKEAQKRALTIQQVARALEFEHDQLLRTDREQAIYNALQRAGIDAGDERAKGVIRLVEAIQDQQEINRQAEKLEEELAKAMEARNRVMEEGRRVTESMLTPQERFVEEQKRLEELLRAGAISAVTYNRALEKQREALEETQQKAQETNDAARELGFTFSSAFEDAIVQGRDLSEVLRGLAQDISRIIIRKTVTEPIANFFSEALGSVFGFESGGIMTARGPVPLRKYAAGGIATGAQLALFGEGRKPEAFVPLPDGRSIPVTIKGGAGAVVNVTTSVTITGGVGKDGLDPQVAARLERQFDRMARQAFQAQLRTEQRPGGMLSGGVSA